MKLKVFFFLLLLTTIFPVTAQEQTKKLSLTEGTIDNQFEYVITKSNRYQDFKVVKTNWLYTLKAHTLDSLKAVEDELSNFKQIVTKQSQEIDALKKDLKEVRANLDKTNIEKNSMSLFGMQMTKTGYNILMWTIIAGLAVFAGIFVFKFKNSNTITKEAKLALAETEEEFEAHRKRALEREQKVMRRLQDEINKQKTSN